MISPKIRACSLMCDSLVCWGLLTSSVWDENGSTISLYPSVPHRYCCFDVRNFRKHTELINYPFTSEESEKQTHYSEDWLGQCFLNSAPWPCLASLCYIVSVMSDSLQPYELSPTRLLCPWDSPGKNTAVGCQTLLQGIKPGSPALQADSLPLSLWGSPCAKVHREKKKDGEQDIRRKQSSQRTKQKETHVYLLQKN